MHLAVDIGNTAIKFGLFEGEKLTSKFVTSTAAGHDREELVREIGDRIGAVDAVIVSSVVPEVNATVLDVLTKQTGREPRLVKPTDDMGLLIDFPVVDAGTDHLINAFAGAELYGAPCVVVAFGTATTIDVVTRERQHIGGLIAPGPRATAKALELIASKLPEVEIIEPPRLVNTNTVDAIRAGILYSQIGLVETAVPHIRSQVGEDARVIATGGFARLIAPKCDVIDIIDADLTLHGLRLLYERA
jgi:type III pantothenate kinase